MNLHAMSDRTILDEIGRRLRRRRLELNLTQQSIADQAGLNRTTVSEIERGKPSGLLTLVQLLRALDSLDDLDAMLPDPGPSPLQLARLKGRERRRASRHSPDDQGGSPTW